MTDPEKRPRMLDLLKASPAVLPPEVQEAMNIIRLHNRMSMIGGPGVGLWFAVLAGVPLMWGYDLKAVRAYAVIVGADVVDSNGHAAPALSGAGEG